MARTRDCANPSASRQKSTPNRVLGSRKAAGVESAGASTRVASPKILCHRFALRLVAIVERPITWYRWPVRQSTFQQHTRDYDIRIDADTPLCNDTKPGMS